MAFPFKGIITFFLLFLKVVDYIFFDMSLSRYIVLSRITIMVTITPKRRLLSFEMWRRVGW
jgi:hypothetical protein